MPWNKESAGIAAFSRPFHTSHIRFCIFPPYPVDYFPFCITLKTGFFSFADHKNKLGK